MESFLTLHFVDGSNLSFEFSVQGNEAARNIKYIMLSPPAIGKAVSAALPRHAIVGARIRT